MAECDGNSVLLNGTVEGWERQFPDHSDVLPRGCVGAGRGC